MDIDLIPIRKCMYVQKLQKWIFIGIYVEIEFQPWEGKFIGKMQLQVHV